MKNTTRLIILGIILLLLALGAAALLSDRFTSDDVVAEVGEETITRHDTDVRIRQSLARGLNGGLSVPEDALFDRALDELITESLLYQDAIRRGFSADPNEVERRYNIAFEKRDSEGEFLEDLKRNLLTPEEFRRNIARQTILFAYLEDLKRQEIEGQIAQAVGGKEANGASIEVTAERAPVSQEDINRLSEIRVEELKREIEVNVYVE